MVNKECRCSPHRSAPLVGDIHGKVLCNISKQGMGVERPMERGSQECVEGDQRLTRKMGWKEEGTVPVIPRGRGWGGHSRQREPEMRRVWVWLACAFKQWQGSCGNCGKVSRDSQL